MLNIQRMRDGTCRSHTARARTPNPKKRKWENYTHGYDLPELPFNLGTPFDNGDENSP